jgi:hypothetical protein
MRGLTDMKHLLLLVTAILCVAASAYSQEPKISPPDTGKTPTATPGTKVTTEDLANLLGFYEKLRPETKPTLMIGPGDRVQILNSPYAQYPEEFRKDVTTTSAVLYSVQIKALKEEVDVLKKLNAALEKQLAECNPQS